MPRLRQPAGPLLIALLVGMTPGPTAAAQLTAAHSSPLELNSGTEIDGIAAVVNDTVITRSEVAEAARGSRFFATLASPVPTPTPALTAEERQASLQHLIDQALLEKSAPPPDQAVLQAELARQLDALRARAGGEEAWQRHLRAARLSEPALERLVRHQVTLLALSLIHI